MPEGHLRRATQFFLWCAGSDADLLRRLPPSETTRQVGFGSLVLIPAILAFPAMSYALSTLTDRALVYLAGGMVWSAIVFAFDRFIVSTLRKSDSTLLDLTSPVFASRLLFAIFVGITVAHPMTLLYFQESLLERLAAEEGQMRTEVASQFALDRQQIERSIAASEETVDGQRAVVGQYRDRLVEEIDGIVSGRTTGIPGRGASANEKKAQLVAAEAALIERTRESRLRIAALRAEIQEVDHRRETALAAVNRSTDYLARVEAFEALAQRSPHVRRVHLFLILFFVFVDTLPIVFKGFTPMAPYDALLRLEEERVFASTSAERESLHNDPFGHSLSRSPSS